MIYDNISKIFQTKFMDGFQVFNKGNRQKFLDQAKKKKQQIITQNRPTQDSESIIRLQKNIRRFLATSNQRSSLFQLARLVQNLPLNQLIKKLEQISTSNNFLFSYVYKFLLSRAQDKYQKNRCLMEEEGYLETLGKYSCKIGPIFGRLLQKEKIFWVRRILKYSPDFTFAYLPKNHHRQIYDILASSMEIFVELVANIPSNSLVYELIILVGSFPLKKPLQAPHSESSLPLAAAYEHLQKTTSNRKIGELGQFPQYLIRTLGYITSQIHTECLFTIMRKYKIDLSFLKAEGELLQQVISEKQQWQCFLDYLTLNSPFNFSVIDFFINLQTFQQSLSVCSYLEVVLHLMPLEDSFNISTENLMVCLKKLSEWIKIHEIIDNQQQQTLLLPYLYLINIKFFKMTDKQFVNLVKKQGEALQRILKDKFIKIIYKVILNSKTNKKIEQITKICINLVEYIYNKIFRTGVLSTEIFVNEVMSKKLVVYTQAKSDNEIVEFVQKFPFIFSLKDRARKFYAILRQYHYMNMDDDYEYDHHGAGRIKIRRGHEFEDAFYYLGNKNIRKGFQISFIDRFGQEQRGVDAGGLTKQFINRVLKAAFQNQLGMFVQNSEKQLLPHPQKSQQVQGVVAQHYQFIGKMIGKALYEGITIGPKFCGPFLNAIIGKKNNFDDLNKIDKHLYNSLAYIKTMKEDASQLYLTFQFEDEILHKKINLKKNGHKIKVTNENKDEYISLLANYKVNKLLEFQSRHIRRGLKKVINSEWLFMFNYEQLNYLISGSGEIKVHQLRNYTRYIGYHQNDVTIKMFWSVVMEFDEQDRSNLLMFVTACPRPSFLGFEELSPPFTITKKNDTNSLPISHTCMNVLELPDYRDKELLAQKLKLAINSGAGFDFA